MTSAPLAARLDRATGPLFFPVTAYGPDGALDLDVFRAHIRSGVDAGAAAVFACCGTGEFHALTPEEFGDCVRAAVEETAGAVPVVAAAGYSTAIAVRYAEIAEAADVDGLLAMPPSWSSPTRRACCATTRRWPPRPAFRPSSTSATTPSSPPGPSSNSPRPTASSASRTVTATST